MSVADFYEMDVIVMIVALLSRYDPLYCRAKNTFHLVTILSFFQDSIELESQTSKIAVHKFIFGLLEELFICRQLLKFQRLDEIELLQSDLFESFIAL